MSVAAVDQALIAKLRTISTSVIPGGVWYATAPPDTPDPFIIVNLMAHDDEYSMSGGHFEVARYLVKAVAQGTDTTEATAAEDAIYTALEDQPLTIAGYTHMLCHREERQQEVEIDGDIRWQHRVGIYAVWASL